MPTSEPQIRIPQLAPSPGQQSSWVKRESIVAAPWPGKQLLVLKSQGAFAQAAVGSLKERLANLPQPCCVC